VEFLSVYDYEAAAAELLEPGPLGYYAGGAGDELTLRDNVEAYRRWIFRPRMLVDVAACSTATTVLGHEVSMPILVAPTAFQRVIHPDGESGMARAARDAGTIFCLSTLTTTTPAEVAEAGGPRWFQVYVFKDDGVTRELVAQARDCGYSALLLTVDAPFRGNRERDARTGFTIPEGITVVSMGKGGVTPRDAFDRISPSLSWRDVERLASEAGLPVLVKGVLTAEDALLAVEHGVAGVVVSNHGGRQLDGVAASLDALPEVVEAVAGRAEVLVDGGVRRGMDAAKALALGARAVLAGRALLWGLAVGGEAGARRVLEILQAELLLAQQLLGCQTPADIGRAHVARRAEVQGQTMPFKNAV
jgi:isopentenyl diphosphate isomerase/L-lactate dehydrogenase-like FMN-dependent dehydrogenase